MSLARAAGRPKRSAGLVHGGLLGALVLVIATVALVARPAAPPAIAEFAPQAIEQIKDAPPGQSSKFGAGGEGACLDALDTECGTPEQRQAAAASSTTTTTTPENVIEVPRVKRCIGDPPRQIEDPQSPPCVPYWKGENGGATSKGVTATEIKIAWPSTFPNENVARFTRFFNNRFQFYGRKLVVEEYGVTGGFYGSSDPAGMIADAVKVDEEMHAFASVSYPFGRRQTQQYYDELARRKIITADSTTTVKTERENYDRKEFEGYQWGFQPALDEVERNLVAWICGSLVGKPPVHAGREFQGTPANPAPNRTFGVIVQQQHSESAESAPLVEGLTRCASKPEVTTINLDDTTTDPSPNIVARYQTAKISSLLCVCDNDAYGKVMSAADNAQYEPEYLLLGALGQNDDSNYAHKHFPPTAFPHLFGMEGNNKINPVTDSPWFWAMKEADPNVQAANYGNFSLGYTLANHEQYQQMLLLASGIQMAGPNLTPETFKAGLMKAEFPNPGAGAAPYYQARVGFGPGNHTMIQDFALVWYDTNRKSDSLGVPGTQCYVGKGSRWSLTTWTPVGAERFFPEATPPTEPCK
jgi:hypothetical protein